MQLPTKDFICHSRLAADDILESIIFIREKKQIIVYLFNLAVRDKLKHQNRAKNLDDSDIIKRKNESFFFDW